MPKLAMVLDPADPKMSPRQMAQRDKLFVVGAVALLFLIVVGAMKLNHLRQNRGAFRAAEARLRAIPAFKDIRLKAAQVKLSSAGAADMVDSDGKILGTVAIQGKGDIYIGFEPPGQSYKPLSAAKLAPYMFSGEQLDPEATRFAGEAAGALLLLWPDLGHEAIRYEKVETTSLAAPTGTVDAGVTLDDGQRVGISVELDLRDHHLLSLNLRKR